MSTSEPLYFDAIAAAAEQIKNCNFRPSKALFLDEHGEVCEVSFDELKEIDKNIGTSSVHCYQNPFPGESVVEGKLKSLLPEEYMPARRERRAKYVGIKKGPNFTPAKKKRK